MQHPDEGTIHAWLDGALSADEAALLEAHVKECPQCAAAVAETRGFIAASSRILTALDNAPRGVIPAAAPPKRFDPMVWRIAASVLVIAGGTALVLRNQGSSSREMAATAPTMETARATAAFDATADSAPASNSVASAPAPGSLSARTPIPRQPESAGDRRTAPSPSAARLSGAIAGTATDLGRRSTGPVASASSAQKVASSNARISEERAASPPAPPAVSAFLPSAGAAAGSVGAADREVAASEPLKVIGSPRRIGASVTVYEIAGDTVTLTESKQVQLSSIVITSAGEARAQNQAMSADAAGASKRAAPKSVAADSQRTAAPPVVASAPVATSLQASAPSTDSNAIRTITWVDPTTGNTLSLSGRTSEARLQQLRVRIEKQRAEAKKTP